MARGNPRGGVLLDSRGPPRCRVNAGPRVPKGWEGYRRGLYDVGQMPLEEEDERHLAPLPSVRNHLGTVAHDLLAELAHAHITRADRRLHRGALAEGEEPLETVRFLPFGVWRVRHDLMPLGVGAAAKEEA